MLEEKNKSTMKIFKLEPKNLDSSAWRESEYQEAIIVRAEDEKMARRKATLTFSRGVEIESKTQPTLFPWESGDHVDCKELNDSKYSIDGDDEILYPDTSDF